MIIWRKKCYEWLVFIKTRQLTESCNLFCSDYVSPQKITKDPQIAFGGNYLVLTSNSEV